MRLALVCLAAAGCALAGRPAARAPLQSEGEVALHLAPLPDEAHTLAFDLVSAYALHGDGLRAPLELNLGHVSGSDRRREQLLARGPLPPGAYSGFALEVRRASLAGTELTISPEPLRIDAPFVIASRRAVVITAKLAVTGERQTVFAPSFTGSTPARTLPKVIALCTNRGTHDTTVFDKRERTVTAILPTGRDPWGVALDPARNRMFVGLSGEDQIAVYDSATQEEQSRIRLTPGDGPRDLVLTADGRTLLTANAGSNTVSFVDASSMIETDRIVVGEEPTWILLDRRGARAFVSNLRSNTISVIDVTNRVLATTLATDERPLRAQSNRAGNRLYVAHGASPFLTIFSLPDLTPVKRVYIGPGSEFLKLDPATDLLYVARRDERRISIYDGFAVLPVDSIEAPGAPAYMAIADAENALFLVLPGERKVAAIELTSKRGLGAVDVGDDPLELAIAGERY